MAKVQFVKAVQYAGERYAAHTPFDVKNKDVDAMVAIGAVLVEGTLPTESEPIPVNPIESKQTLVIQDEQVSEEMPDELQEPESDAPVTIDALLAMTTAELRQFAQREDIRVPSAGTKADVYNAIVLALKK